MCRNWVEHSEMLVLQAQALVSLCWATATGSATARDSGLHCLLAFAWDKEAPRGLLGGLEIYLMVQNSKVFAQVLNLSQVSAEPRVAQAQLLCCSRWEGCSTILSGWAHCKLPWSSTSSPFPCRGLGGLWCPWKGLPVPLQQQVCPTVHCNPSARTG